MTTVNLTVNAVNDAPVGVADSYTTAEDAALTVNAASGALANDTDIDGNALSAVLVSGPSHGTLTLNGDGSFTYTPTANYNGADSFTYKPNDGTADGNVTTVNLTVNAVNDAPTAANGSLTTNENSPYSGTLPAATDIDSNTISYAVAGNPTHGTVTIASNGTYTYTPAPNYSGSDTFTYTVSDGAGGANTYSIAITVVTAPTPVVVPQTPPTISNTTDTPNDPTPNDLITGDATQVLTVQGGTGASGFVIYVVDSNGNATVFGRNNGPLTEPSTGTYAIDLQSIALPAGTYAIAFEYGGVVGPRSTNSFVVDSTPALWDRTVDRVLMNAQTGQTSGQLALLDQSRQDLTPSEPGVSLVVGSGKLAAILPQWLDIDGDVINFGISGVTPVGGRSTITLASGSTLVLDAATGAYEYRPGGGSGTDVFNVYAQDPSGKGGTLRLVFNPNDTLDRDGIPLQAESNLAKLIMGGSNIGDFNNDGIADAEQNAVATLAWITSDNFQTGVVYAGTGVAPPASSIIYIAVSQAGSGVEAASQLTDISVLSTASGSAFTGGRPSGANITTNWDPIQFAIEPLESLGLRDANTNQAGVQSLVDINISNAKVPVVGGFNAYMKYISADTIQSYLNAGLPLITLDGERLTTANQAGWYDFTQRSAGGDGARFVDSNGDGYVDFIRLQITDNSFGDNDPRTDRILDPGVPVLRGAASATFVQPVQAPIAAASFVMNDTMPFQARRQDWQGFSTPLNLDFDTTPASIGRGLSSLLMPRDPMNSFIGSDLIDAAVCTIDPQLFRLASYQSDRDGRFALVFDTTQQGRYAFEGFQTNGERLPDWIYVNPFSGEISGRFPDAIDAYQIVLRQYDDCGAILDQAIPLRRDVNFTRLEPAQSFGDQALVADFGLFNRDGGFVVKLTNAGFEPIVLVGVRAASGQPLPAWIGFDPVTATLSGILPTTHKTVDLLVDIRTAAGIETIPLSFSASQDAISAVPGTEQLADSANPVTDQNRFDRTMGGLRPFSMQLKDVFRAGADGR